MSTQAQVIVSQETGKTTPVAAQQQSTAPAQNNAAGATGGSNFAGISSSIFAFVDFLNELSTNEGLINTMNTMLKLSESQVEQETTKQKYAKQAKLQEMDAIKGAVSGTISLVSVGLENFDASVGEFNLSKAGTLDAESKRLTSKLGELEEINKGAMNKLNSLPSGDLEQTLEGRGPAAAAKDPRLNKMATGDLVSNNTADPAISSRKQTNAQETIKHEMITADPANVSTNWDEYFQSEDGQKAVTNKMNEIDRADKMNAIRNAGPGDEAILRSIKDQSDRQISDTVKKMETNASQMTANNAKIRLGSEFVKGAVDAGIDAKKASITRNIGEIEAANQAATYSKQTLDQMQQNLTQQIKENFDTLRSFLSGLAQAATRA